MAIPEEMADPKQEKFLAILREIDRDTTTPMDVAEALHAVFNFIMEKHGEAAAYSDTILSDARREDQSLFDRVRRLINAATSEARAEEGKIRKLVKALYDWKDSEVKARSSSTLESDVASALDAADQNTEAIRKVRIALKKLKREPGPRGPRGRVPAHEWENSSIRFQNPDGTWGEWMDLRGPSGGSIFGGPSGNTIFGITTHGTSGPATLSQSGILNIPQYTSTGGGTTQSTIDPSETPDDVLLVYTFATKPFLIVVNQRTYRENHGWTWNAGTGEATLSATDPGPVGTGNEIYGIIQS